MEIICKKYRFKTVAVISACAMLVFSSCSLPKKQMQEQFDQFTYDLFVDEVQQTSIDLNYSLADPLVYGIEQDPECFGEFSLEWMVKNLEEQKKLLKELQKFRTSSLTEDQKLTYEILESYLDTSLSGEGLELYEQPISDTIGVQAQLPILLAEFQFRKREDIDSYLALLSKIDDYYAELLQFEQEKSAAGLFMSDSSADRVIKSCEDYLTLDGRSFLEDSFQERLSEMPDISTEDQQAYLLRNQELVNGDFVQAYQLLADGFRELKGTGENEWGLAAFPKGKEFYEYLVNRGIGTSFSSIDRLKEEIQKQIQYDYSQLMAVYQENPDDEENASTGFNTPTEILENLKQQIKQDFPELPEYDYTVKSVPDVLENFMSPAFYVTPPLDDYDDHTIYINEGYFDDAYDSPSLYTTLAHEGFPGHLYQSAYFANSEPCELRNLLSFSSYSEGWATYVEQYAYTLENGLSDQTKRLMKYSSSLSLGMYALLDICIHYDGWNLEQTEAFLQQTMGDAAEEAAQDIYTAVVDNPSNYLIYYTGYLEITVMKQLAEDELGKKFELKQFNKFLLDIGPAPFTVIREHFDQWLKTQQS